MTAVAIDGPAGSGKSTVAREVAGRLGFVFVDTGAMYRAVALAALERGVDVTDPLAVADVAMAVKVCAEDGRVVLDGSDVGDRIRHDDVSAAASRVAEHPGVRDVLVRYQRAAAAGKDVVMEGRDIATVVLPNADVKIFLTAPLSVRARRRVDQLHGGTAPADLGLAQASIARRDAADSTRSASPLVKAPDAVEIDTTSLSVDDVATRIVDLVRRRTKGG